MDSRSGIVYLVGAGPGDVGLITVRGVECLQSCDVVVYDNLASELLLDHVPMDAERIFAGKEASQHSRSQDEINELLVERAQRGLRVVRLKGGDPYLFGRGGEEAAYLAVNSVPFEVVPGVTSAIAVPAYAGIPVTHRDVNGSLHIVTGHENVDGKGPEIDWEVLGSAKGTIVFLMGVGNLPQITRKLMTGGMPGNTPIALIRWGTTPEQVTLVSTLSQVVEETKKIGLTPPAVGVIGEVVNLRRILYWVEKRPLFGVRVAVTRPVEQNAAMIAELRAFGAEVVATPTIRIRRYPYGPEAKAEIEALEKGRYDWIVFTSANSVRIFRDHLRQAEKDLRILSSVSIAAIGERTAEVLDSMGIRADLVPHAARQEGLAGAMQTRAGDRVLIPRAAEARQVLEEELAARAVDVHVWRLYETVADRQGIAKLRKLLTRGRIHVVTFTSASTFEKLLEAIKAEDIPKLFADVAIASIGPITSEAMRKYRLNVAAEAEKPDPKSLAKVIVAWRQYALSQQ